MQSFTNLSRIRLYARISRVMAFGGLGLMGLAVLVSLRPPYSFNLVFTLLIIGMLTSQIGLPLRNRWDREPRFDQVLDEGLKGLDKRFVVFHHFLGASHVLNCPSGVFALIPRIEDGEIAYRDGQWLRTLPKGGLLRRAGPRALRGLGREAEGEAGRAQRRLARLTQAPKVEPLLVFLHSGASVQPDGAPIPVTHIKKLKSTLRKLPKNPSLTEPQLETLQAQLKLTS